VPLDRLASSNLAEAIKKGITMQLDDLEENLKITLQLLQERELGLNSWNSALTFQLEELAGLIEKSGISVDKEKL
jgi:hypothetical protein